MSCKTGKNSCRMSDRDDKITLTEQGLSHPEQGKTCKNITTFIIISNIQSIN